MFSCFRRPKIKAADLHVVLVLSNPVRYKRRPELMKAALAHVEQAGATAWLVEAVFGDREPEVANPLHPRHTIVRCDHEIWLKENLINIGAAKLPANWRYMMWMDGDIEFTVPNWPVEIIQGLQHYSTLQPFSHAIDMGPQRQALEVHTGFGFQYLQRGAFTPGYGTFWHPGYAWAWRREAWDAVGGMIDKAVCGAGDHHMATALIGRGHLSVHAGVSDGYKHMVADWERRAETALERNLGCVPGVILHHFHGAKTKRNYVGRWDVVVKTKYDPEVHISHDEHGVLQLHKGQSWLRDLLHDYFRSRDEDGGL